MPARIVCGRPFKAKRSSRRYCGQRCRKRAERQRRADQAEHVTLRPNCEPTLSVTSPGAPWWRRPERRQRCAYCGMAIEAGELAAANYHAECKRYVEMRDRPADQPGGQLWSDRA